MIRSLLFTTLVLVGARAFAVEPMPKSDTKEKVENIRQGGALKVEQKPAVNPKDLDLKASDVETAPMFPAEEKKIETPAPKPDSGSRGGGEHLFGLHASLGVPHPINFGLNYVVPNRLFSFEVSTGSFGITVSDVELKLQNTEFAARWHPFYGSFFVGALLGNQKITGKKTETVTSGMISQDVHAEVEVKSNYVTPQIGWMWGTDGGGFFAMIELGFQSPSGVKSEFSSDVDPALQNTEEYAKLKKDVEDGGDKIGKSVLPQLALLKIGWLF